jgi:hypothetical protein
MIKKQRKWVALFVVCTFAWLMHMSAMPVAAAGAPEQGGAAVSEQGTSHYEIAGQKAAPAKKKSMLPWILIGVGVLGATAAVLFLVVLKTKYDPLGSWSGPMSNQYQNWTGSMTFSGKKKSGTVSYSDPWLPNQPGTFTVDKENITIMLNLTDGSTVSFTGTFKTKDMMSGTWKNNSAPTTVFGNWQMNRAGTAAQQPVVQNLAAGRGISADR